MLTLTTNNGTTIEADTERELMRKFRKAKKEEAAAQAEFNARYAIANTRAAAEGFYILDRKAQGYRQQWTLYGADANYSPVIWHVCQSGYYVLTIESSDGKAELRWSGRYIGCAVDAAGWCRAIFIEDNGEFCCYAVGLEGDAIACKQVHGVTKEDFEIPQAN